MMQSEGLEAVLTLLSPSANESALFFLFLTFSPDRPESNPTKVRSSHFARRVELLGLDASASAEFSF